VSWPVILTLAEIAWILVAGTAIVLQRRSATATVAWVLAVALLPVVGFIIYWLIGPQRLKRTKLARVASAQQVAAAMAGLEEAKLSAPEHARLSLVPLGLGEAPPLAAHAITPYLDGRSAYAAICAAIEAARHHVHLEYYIWEPDGIGTRLRDLLIAKARAGVEVRMLVDGTGAVGLRRGWRAPLYAAGVQFAWFNPLTLKLWRRRRADFRTHRKIVVCDGAIGFTGGMNVADAQSEEFGAATGATPTSAFAARRCGRCSGPSSTTGPTPPGSGRRSAPSTSPTTPWSPTSRTRSRSSAPAPTIRGSRSTRPSSRRSPRPGAGCGSRRRTSSPMTRS
jgi:hypothetical protein